MTRSLSMLVHGGPKVGKTRLADTAPPPRLFLDAEGGVRFTPSRKVEWDPERYAPPEPGDWETCVVYVRSHESVQRVYQWLAAGKHPFRSVVMDSVSEVQQRCVDAIAGHESMQTQQWGELLRKMSSLVRSFRDLTFHPTNPLEAVILVAMTREVNGRWKPYVQGQLGVTLPYYYDVVGYMFTQLDETNTLRRRLLTQPVGMFEAGDRTGMLPTTIEDPTVPGILDTIYGVTHAS